MPPPISRSVRPAIPRATRKSTIRRPSPSSPLRRYFRASELARASPKTARRPFGSQQSAITRTLDARARRIASGRRQRSRISVSGWNTAQMNQNVTS